ncbi:MAG: membrane dipeptidase [Leptospiraceae bacterium]|nr:membrane dipeptidase [Leptospiraceae bacterium]
MPLRTGRPWLISPQAALELNTISSFAYIEKAVQELQLAGLDISRSADLDAGSDSIIWAGLEGADLLNTNPGLNPRPANLKELRWMVKQLRAMQFSYVGLTWAAANPYAGSSNQAHIGLSVAGGQLVALLHANELLVDLSHASDQTVIDYYQLTGGRRPLFFSHSSIRAVCSHPRNVSDATLDLIQKSDGLIGLNFHAPYLSCKAQAGSADLIRHIQYVKQKIGMRYLALGSDYDGLITEPHDLKQPEQLRSFALALLQIGFSRAEIESLYYRNAIRFWKRNVTVSTTR